MTRCASWRTSAAIRMPRRCSSLRESPPFRIVPLDDLLRSERHRLVIFDSPFSFLREYLRSDPEYAARLHVLSEDYLSATYLDGSAGALCPEVDEMPVPQSAGLCATCLHARTVTSDRGSTFVWCGLSKSDPRFPKYPRLPVLAARAELSAEFHKACATIGAMSEDRAGDRRGQWNRPGSEPGAAEGRVFRGAAGRRARELERTAAMARRTGGAMLAVPADVSDPAAVKALFAAVQDGFRPTRPSVQ